MDLLIFIVLNNYNEEQITIDPKSPIINNHKNSPENIQAITQIFSYEKKTYEKENCG